MKKAERIFPVYKVEHAALLAATGELTIGYRVELPELFTLSNEEYLAFHQTWVKALRLLPENTIFHKQDWFVEAGYQAQFGEQTFLARASERFFHERPYLAHRCHIFLTKRPEKFQPVTSAYSGLMRKQLVPQLSISPELFRDFEDHCGQFKRILEDSGLVSLRRFSNEQLAGTTIAPGVLEQYCFLIGEDEQPVLKDIHFEKELRIGDEACQLYTLADVNDLPALCGPRVT